MMGSQRETKRKFKLAKDEWPLWIMSTLCWKKRRVLLPTMLLLHVQNKCLSSNDIDSPYIDITIAPIEWATH